MARRARSMGRGTRSTWGRTLLGDPTRGRLTRRSLASLTLQTDDYILIFISVYDFFPSNTVDRFLMLSTPVSSFSFSLSFQHSCFVLMPMPHRKYDSRNLLTARGWWPPEKSLHLDINSVSYAPVVFCTFLSSENKLSLSLSLSVRSWCWLIYSWNMTAETNRKDIFKTHTHPHFYVVVVGRSRKDFHRAKTRCEYFGNV